MHKQFNGAVSAVAWKHTALSGAIWSLLRRYGAVFVVIFISSSIMLGPTPAKASNNWNWEKVGGTGMGGPDGTVYAMAASTCGLYVGGTFETVNNSTTGDIKVYGVAKYSERDQRWYALGGGTNGLVKAIAVDPYNCNDIFVGGTFTKVYTNGTRDEVSAKTVNYVARWTGYEWLPVGNASTGVGTDRPVYALARDPQYGTHRLYVGGDFERAGNAVANSVAVWNGSGWAQVGNGLDGWTEALAVGDQGRVYAAGGFAGAQNNGAAYVAQWNGGTWQRLGQGGMDGRAYALTIHRGAKLADESDDILYAGGLFTAADVNVAASRIARWQGGQWSALGTGVNGQVAALAVDRCGAVYAGGYNVTQAGSVSVSQLARWSTVYDAASDEYREVWSAPGSGTNNNVLALAVSKDPQKPEALPTIYVGGAFTGVDGTPTTNIARATNPIPTITVKDVEVEERDRLMRFVLRQSEVIDAKVSIQYETIDDTAKGAKGNNVGDFIYANSSQYMSPCVYTADIGITVRCSYGDHTDPTPPNLPNPDEQGIERFTIALRNPLNAMLARNVLNGTIHKTPTTECPPGT